MDIRKGRRATLAGHAIAWFASAVLLTGCAPSTTTRPTTASTPDATPPKEVATMAFTLTSPAFADGAPMPRRLTCDGDDVSPALEWSGAPDATASFVLIVDDPDARGFVHWVLFDLTGSGTGGVPEGFADSPDAPPQGTNGFGRVGYGGPCPPSGTHRYVFTLAALDVPTLGLSGAPKADEVRVAIAGHILGTAVLTGTYAR